MILGFPPCNLGNHPSVGFGVFEDFDTGLAVFNVPTTTDKNRWADGTTDPYGSSSKSVFVNDNTDPGVIDYDPNTACENSIYYSTLLTFPAGATSLNIKCKLGGENNGSTIWDSVRVYLLKTTATENESYPDSGDILYDKGRELGTATWTTNFLDIVVDKATAGIGSTEFKLCFMWENDGNAQSWAYSVNLVQMEWV